MTLLKQLLTFLYWHFCQRGSLPGPEGWGISARKGKLKIQNHLLVDSAQNVTALQYGVQYVLQSWDQAPSDNRVWDKAGGGEARSWKWIATHPEP